MALEKEIKYEYFISELKNIQIRKVIEIKEDGEVYSRNVIIEENLIKGSPLEGKSQEVIAIANAIWV